MIPHSIVIVYILVSALLWALLSAPSPAKEGEEPAESKQLELMIVAITWPFWVALIVMVLIAYGLLYMLGVRPKKKP